MFGGAFLAVFSIDLKRTLACSSMSQIGFILVGTGMTELLGEENALAVRGTILHMVNHSLIKLILFMAALASIPKDILEVATLESAKPLQTFFYIKIRYLSSTLLFVTIMSLINSFKIFREVYLLTGNYPVDTIYTLQHFMNNKFGSLDYQTLSAAAILMSLVMIVIIGILFIVENHFGKDVEG
jgi:multiple sugar transport system permease protein